MKLWRIWYPRQSLPTSVIIVLSHGQYLTYVTVHDSNDGHAVRSLANAETIYPPTCRVVFHDARIFPHQQATE